MTVDFGEFEDVDVRLNDDGEAVIELIHDRITQTLTFHDRDALHAFVEDLEMAELELEIQELEEKREGYDV